MAVHRSDLVQRLVLIDAALPGWEWADDTRAGWAAEETAYEAGDLETAAEESVRLWVDGPNRSPEEVDGGFRTAVTGMVLRSYEMQQGAWEAGAREEDVLDPPIGGRLDEIRCPTLVLVGEQDVADMRAIATHLAESISGARLATVADASHLPSLERADEVNSLLLAFLGES